MLFVWPDYRVVSCAPTLYPFGRIFGHWKVERGPKIYLGYIMKEWKLELQLKADVCGRNETNQSL